jgi:hypothetical protein
MYACTDCQKTSRLLQVPSESQLQNGHVLHQSFYRSVKTKQTNRLTNTIKQQEQHQQQTHLYNFGVADQSNTTILQSLYLSSLKCSFSCPVKCIVCSECATTLAKILACHGVVQRGMDVKLSCRTGKSECQHALTECSSLQLCAGFQIGNAGLHDSQSARQVPQSVVVHD